MKNKNIEPGDVEIRKILLYKWGANKATPIDLLGQTISFSIYEDVEEPSMLLEITLVDSLNLLQNYPIIGEEVIEVSFNTPGRENVYKKSFYVYNVEGVSNNPNAKASTYTLKAVTPLHYFSSRFIIKKTYNNTVDQIVRDIVNSATVSNGIGTSRIYTESTRGLVPIAIPSLTAFEAIDYVRQRAVSAEYPSGGVFLFFENQYGYQFRSIEGIISEGKKQIATKEFTYAPATNADKQRSQYSFRNILNFQNSSRFDSINKITSGTINNTVEAFNMLTKQTEVVRFNFAEKAKTFVSTDPKSRVPNSTGFLERFNNTDKNYFMAKDSSKGNDYLDSMYGSKNAYSMLLNENVLRVLINGDSYISAGDVVKLNLPDTSGTTEKKAGDRMNSGNYIITKLRHIISTEQGAKPKHQIAFDCARMGYK
jgi:hypothetical protein